MIIDITNQFHDLAQVHSKERLPVNKSIEFQLCEKQAEDLFSSLHKVATIMTENRQNYFANAAYSFEAFTDQQRNEFQNEIKSSLELLGLKISEFNDVTEKVVTETVTEKEHMKNMVICLYQFYKRVSRMFKEFIQFNENRKRKLQSIVSLDARKSESAGINERVLEKMRKSEESMSRKESVDEELQKQSQMIFMEKVSEHKKIEDTKKTLEKINDLLAKIENKVLEQQILTSSFRQIGEVGLFHIQKGNKNLLEANVLARQSGKYWTLYFLALAFSLLFLDFLKS